MNDNCFGCLFQLRVSALGLASSFARMGGVVAPYIALMVRTSHQWYRVGNIIGYNTCRLQASVTLSLPYITLSAAGLVAGLICLLIPETVNLPLPQTAEGESLGFFVCKWLFRSICMTLNFRNGWALQALLSMWREETIPSGFGIEQAKLYHALSHVVSTHSPP